MAKVQWSNDYESSLKKAGDEKKPLFLDFFKDG